MRTKKKYLITKMVDGFDLRDSTSSFDIKWNSNFGVPYEFRSLNDNFKLPEFFSALNLSRSLHEAKLIVNTTTSVTV